MRTLYHDRGYLDAKVELEPITLGGRHTNVRYTIVEGRRAVFDAVKYVGGPEGFPPAESAWMLTGQPFSQRTVERGRQALATELARRGYTYATVEADWVLGEKGQADVAFRQSPGPQVHVGKIFVRGLYRTDESVVRGQLVLAEGKTLSPDDLLDSQRN